MIIKQLKLQNYKKFKELEIHFVSGINILIGPNEAGKSTIGEAILDTLYADPATQSKNFLNRIHAWQGDEKVVLEMQFEGDGADFELVKDFSQNSLVLKNLSNGKTSESYKTLIDTLEKVIGIGSSRVYESTAYVKQSDIASIERKEDLLSAIHKVALSTGLKINIDQIVQDVDKQIKALKLGLERPAKNPGDIKMQMDRIEDLKHEFNNKSALWQKLTQAAKEHRSSASQLDEIKAQVQTIEELLENHKIYNEAYKKLSDLDSKIMGIEEQLKSAENLIAKKTDLDSKLQAFSNFADQDLDQIGRKLTTFQETVKVSANELKRLEDTKLSYAKSGDQNKISYVQSIVAIALFISGIALFKVSGWIGLLLGIVVSGVLAYLNLKNNKLKKAKNKLIKQDQSELQHLINQLTEKKQNAAEALNKAFTAYNVANLDEFYAKRADYVALSARKNEVEARLQGELRGNSVEALKNKQIEYIREKKEITINDLTDQVKASKLSPESYLRKSRELDTLYLQKKQLEEETTTYRVRIEDSDVSSEDLIDLEEKLKLALDNLKFLKNKLAVYELISKTLYQAMDETVKGVGKIVKDRIEQYLPFLTNNKYKNIQVTENLGIEIFSEEKKGWIEPVANLSRGTVDQIYFLSRIAFLQTLIGKKSTPLIFDDPFVTFDQKRSTQVLNILKDLAKYYQIIIMTHSTNYSSWGEVIKLAE